MADAAEAPRDRPRIAVVFQGDPTDPTAWSGVPAGISTGLAAAGADPISVDARIPGAPRLARVLRLDWIGQTTNPLFAAGGGRRAEAAIRSAGAVAGALTIGSGFSLRSSFPTATYDDMTVVQALAQPGSEYEQRGRATGAALARAAAPQLRTGQGLLRRQRVGRDLGPRGLRDRPGQGPRRRFRPQLRRAGGRARLERAPLRLHRHRLGAQAGRTRWSTAFAAVRERHPEATLDLIGGHPPVSAPGVNGHGVLALDSAADRERQAAILAAATCHVLPSSFEPFGIAYVDAGASGVPSIGTTSGGAATAIGDGGVLVDPGDREALLAAMLDLCDPRYRP